MTLVFAFVFPVIAIGCGIAVLYSLGPFVRDIREEIYKRPAK